VRRDRSSVFRAEFQCRSSWQRLRVGTVASEAVSALELEPWPPLPHDLGEQPTGWSPKTLAVSSGRPKGAGATLNQPLVLASNFRDGGDYVRTHGTESWVAFEDAVGALEGGHALSFASGMAVASAILHALMPKVIVLPNASYMGVRTLIAEVAAGHGIEVRLVDVTNTAEVLAAAQGADVVWLESPTNPTLEVADLATLCSSLSAMGVPTVIDSTFATPLGQQPLTLGARIVLHSATKFIGGHSDLLLGVAVTRDRAIYEALFRARTYVGATPGALETFLALRGLRTLPLRFGASSSSAVELAKRLRAHPAVSSVRQIGPMMAVIVRGGATVADWVCAHVQLLVPATSLGGVETTLERRQKYGGDSHIDPGLLRVSVGIEDVEDLWTDLLQALASAPTAA
jgi:cystathionine gamma-synthase